MRDLVICEICGATFETSSSSEICGSCRSTDRSTNATQKLRKTAKNFGAKALKGTSKQKKWGESLRLQFINDANDIESVKALICSPSLETAKFWIENRNNSNVEADLVEILKISEKLNAGEGEDADAERRIELIGKLGIT